MDPDAVAHLLERLARATEHGRLDAAPPRSAIHVARLLSNIAYRPLLEMDPAAANVVADAIDLLGDALRMVDP